MSRIIRSFGEMTAAVIGRGRPIVTLFSGGLDSAYLLHRLATAGATNVHALSVDLGDIEDNETKRRVDFKWATRAPAVPRVARLRIGVENGLPVAVDGESMVLTDLIDRLNKRVGAFGHGKYTGLEHLPGGQKVLEVREMPAAWIIFKTLRHLETAALSAEALRIKLVLEQIWVREALEGRWYQPLRQASERFFETTAQSVNGYVDWKLTASGAETTSVVASSPLYLRDREAWEKDDIAIETSALRMIDNGPTDQLMAIAV